MTARAWNTRPEVLGIIAGVMAFGGFLMSRGSFLSLRTQDALLFSSSQNERVALVTIDDESLATLSPWPWSRNLHAELINKIRERGASLIVYDVDFSEPNDAVHDDAIVSAIRDAGNVILLPSFLRAREVSRAIGSNDVTPDADGVVRQLPVRSRSADGFNIPLLGFAAATIASPDAVRAREFPDAPVRLSFAGAPEQTVLTMSAATVLHDDPASARLRDRVVFVGRTSASEREHTPLAGTDGRSRTEIQAVLFDTIDRHREMVVVPLFWEALFILLCSLGTASLLARKRARARWMRVAIAFIVVWLITALFLHFDIVLEILWPTLGMVFSAMIVVMRERKERTKTASNAASPMVMTHAPSMNERWNVIASRGEITRRRLTVATMPVGTWLASKLDEGANHADKLAHLWQEWKTVIFEEEGTVPNENGTLLCAVWNAPIDQPDHAVRAVRAAIRFRHRLEAMDADPPSIIIQTDDRINGFLATSSEPSFFVADDDDAARCERQTLAREMHVGIVITDTTKQSLGAGFVLRLLGENVFEVIGSVAEVSDTQRDRIRLYEQALISFHRGDGEGALDLLRRLLDQDQKDGPALWLQKKIHASTEE